MCQTETGEDQIWLLEDGQERKLSSFTDPSTIDEIHWSPDGKSIAFVYQDKISRIDLSGNVSIAQPDIPVRYISHWYENTKMLVVANGEKVRELFELDLINGTSQSLQVDQVEKAWRNESQLTVLARNRELWTTSISEHLTSPVTQYNSHAKAKRTLATNARLAVFDTPHHKIYWLNHEDRVLHQVDLVDFKTTQIKTLKPKTSFISDIHGGSMLLEQYIAAKKEVVLIE